MAEDCEIVILNDSSTDRTGEIVTALKDRIAQIKLICSPSNSNVGLSSQKAVMNATKEYLFWQTIDWAYDIAFEAAATLVFKHFGYNLEESLALAIGLHMSQLILPVLMAAVIFLTEHIGVAGLVESLKDLSVDAKRQNIME